MIDEDIKEIKLYYITNDSEILRNLPFVCDVSYIRCVGHA